MARIDLLEPPYSGGVEAAFDRIMPAGVPPLALFRAVARSDRAWEKFQRGSLLDKGPLSLREREIVILRACAKAGCEYEWGVHVTFFSERAGLSREEVAATLISSPAAGRWSAAERALVESIDALHEHAALTQAQFAALADGRDEAQVLEVMMLAGFYRTVAYLANGLDLPAEPFAARFSDYR